MGHHELAVGKSNDYYTPKYVLDALDCGPFDMDVAAAEDPRKAHIIAKQYLSCLGLETPWNGFVWCNPPYGVRGTKTPWIEKMILHFNGLMLMPDRTSADWWQLAARRCLDYLVVYDKIKFESPAGLPTDSPSTGNTIFAFGGRALSAIQKAEINDLGMTARGVDYRADSPMIIVVGVSPSWRSVVTIAIGRVRGSAAVNEIYDLVEQLARDKCSSNRHWKAKVRQKLRHYFKRTAKGSYSSDPRNPCDTDPDVYTTFPDYE